MHGKGQLTFADGVVYTGDMRQNNIHGRGAYLWPDGSTYNGTVRFGVRDGEGEYVSAGGRARYCGGFKQGARHGQGTLHYEDGSQYVGSFVHSKRHGRGKMTYKNGNTYMGEWQDDLRHGEGEMVWATEGQKYTGNWRADRPDGLGTHVWQTDKQATFEYPKRNSYTGEWKEGTRHGHGLFTFASGATFDGYWVNNAKHGKGTMTYENGLVASCEFEMDKARAAADPHDVAEIVILPVEYGARGSTEREQIRCAVLRHVKVLKEVYCRYATMGQLNSLSPLTLDSLQMQRLLLDYNVDRFAKDLQLPSFETDQGVNKEYLFADFVRALIAVGDELFSEEFKTSKWRVADAFDALVARALLSPAPQPSGFLYPSKTVLQAWGPELHVLVQASTKLAQRKALQARKVLAFLNSQLGVRAQLATQVLSTYVRGVASVGSAVNLQVPMIPVQFVETVVGCWLAQNPQPSPRDWAQKLLEEPKPQE
eukprot:m.117734 g.117734  ORF g.117734 m.117734 type:complete len:481 (-) comp16103_c0_seq4:1496-2938(-)